jgi:Trypsin-like peptidase domain
MPCSASTGEKPYSLAPARGCLQVPDRAYDFAPGTPLFIVQHPKGAPLKLALDTNAVIGLNGNGTRVRYRTNTDKGSSGSPVFDQNWNLVALHHSGDPSSLLPTYWKSCRCGPSSTATVRREPRCSMVRWPWS